MHNGMLGLGLSAELCADGDRRMAGAGTSRKGQLLHLASIHTLSFTDGPLEGGVSRTWFLRCRANADLRPRTRSQHAGVVGDHR